LGKCVRHL